MELHDKSSKVDGGIPFRRKHFSEKAIKNSIGCTSYNFPLPYIIPNEAIADKTPLDTFGVKIEKIERTAGLLFERRFNCRQSVRIRVKFTYINPNGGSNPIIRKYDSQS